MGRTTIPDDLGRRRGAPPRNGAHLNDQARDLVARHVDALIARLLSLSAGLRAARFARGKRTYRRDCWTATQRAAVKRATKELRREAKPWVAK